MLCMNVEISVLYILIPDFRYISNSLLLLLVLVLALSNYILEEFFEILGNAYLPVLVMSPDGISTLENMAWRTNQPVFCVKE